MTRRLLAILGLLLAVPIARAPAAHAPTAHAIDLAQPWPDPATITDIHPTTISFPSSDPFTPADWKSARHRTVDGLLYLPPGASPTHKVPAVVLLHGSIGNVEERGWRYGLPLAERGVAVLAPETYASRTDLATSFLGRALHITETMFDADAYAALAALARRPDIDAAHIVLIGFSYGGMATQYAAMDTIADRFAQNGERFAGFVSYYGPCIASFADRRTTGAPILMLWGAGDELIHADRCEAFARDAREGGSEVTLVSYPGAVHQWDGELSPHLVGRHLADCRFTVAPDGTVHDARTGIAMMGPATRALILALCTDGRHWPIGRNDEVAARSNHDLGAFLDRVFDR